jgi:hypothetical protein
MAPELLLTQAEDGALYVYYGTLLSETSAQRTARHLHAQGIDSLTQAETWNGRTVYQLFLGPFTNPAEADAVLTRTDFPHIPSSS